MKRYTSEHPDKIGLGGGMYEDPRGDWVLYKDIATGDPRLSPDWGTRRPDSEIRQLLSAILDELYKITNR